MADSKLTATAKALVLDPANQLLISPASYWEIAIKVSVGKLTLLQPYEDFVDACLVNLKLAILPIEPGHTAVVSRLPFHHRDPFDRMLVAQALAESIPIISGDTALDAYGVTRLW